MALIVEDGSGVAGANTYIDDAFLVAYAADRNITLPPTAPEREPLIIKAKDYVESFYNRYIGFKSNQNNPLQWPRVQVYIYGYSFPSNQIPVELQNGQAQAAIEVQTQALFENTGKDVKKEKVDVIEVEYNNGGALVQPSFPNVDTYLEALFKSQFTEVFPVR